MPTSNIEKLAQAIDGEPTVSLGEDTVTVTARAKGAAYTASAKTASEAARRILDELGVE